MSKQLFPHRKVGITLEIKASFRKLRFDPAQIIVLGFIAVILAGTFLLMLPISSVTRQPTGFIDSLFTATSATCVTGLTVVETGVHWSFFGKTVILLLIQTGGLGFMSIALLFSLIVRRRITPRERMVFAQSQSISDLSGIVKFVKFIFCGTFFLEFIGAVLLSIRFIPEFGIINGFFKSIFHSVSAFCNAGFDTIGKYNSLSDYVADPLVSLVICALIIIGGLGFIVWRDLFLYFKKRQNLSFYSKIVLLMTVSMLAGGTVLIFIFECENPNFSSYSIPTLLLASFFQSTVTRTAGFFSINLAEMSSPSVAVSMLLMFIGGASGSTAGGIKVATLAVVIIAVISIMKGKNNFEIFHRRISLNNTLRAMGILALAFTVVTAFTFLICLIQPEFTFTQVLYEVISAFATVGQTLGITTELNAVSKLLISLLMYFGRVGIITFTYAVLFKQSKSENLILYPEANVLLG